MARTHTAGGGGKKAGARGCALSSACAEAPPLLGRQPPRRRLHGYSKPSRFTPLWARTRPSPSRPGHGEEFQSIALVCPERTIGYKRSLKCVTALESRSDAPPAVRSGMASLRACACAAERRSRIPALLHATPQVRRPAGRRPPCAWERCADGTLGCRYRWHRLQESVGVTKRQDYRLHRARGSSPASRFGYQAERPLPTPSN